MRYGRYDHKNTSHFPVAVTRQRLDAIGRVADKHGISKQMVVDRFITLGLLVNGEDET